MVATSKVAKDKKLCKAHGCMKPRYINKRGKVTTQCVCHNIKNYKRNHVNGGNMLEELCEASPQSRDDIVSFFTDSITRLENIKASLMSEQSH